MRVFGRNAPADLHSGGVRLQGFSCCGIVSRAKFDDMSTMQAVAAVLLCKPSGGAVGHIIFDWPVSLRRAASPQRFASRNRRAGQYRGETGSSIRSKASADSVWFSSGITGAVALANAGGISFATFRFRYRMAAPQHLDPRLSKLLESLRGRIRRYVLWDSVLAIAAVILSAFWIGLALDYLPVWLGGTEMPRLARLMLLVLVAAIIIGIVVKMLIGRLGRPLPDDSLALLVERHYPELGGRLVTAVQLNEPGRKGDSHSPKLLEEVHDQAAAAIEKVDPNRIFRWEPLLRKAMIVGPLALLSLLLLIFSPSSFARAASRLTLLSDEPWPRRAHLEMVGVELPIIKAADAESGAPQLVPFVDRAMRLPRGSNGTLRIRAKADGAELPVVCSVQFRTESGSRIQSNMRRIGRVVDGYQAFVVDGPPLTGLAESLVLDVRGLDDRLDNFRIEAVPPPALTDVRVRVRYPDYLREQGSGPVDFETSYQAGLRVREGSNISLIATSSTPLGETDVIIKSDLDENGQPELVYSEDGSELTIPIQDFHAASMVSIVPYDQNGISAQAPYRYFLGVVLDQPPELKVRLVGIGTAVTPIAKIPVEATATDDYGVRQLKVSVSPVASEGEGDDVAGETVSVSPALDREGNATTEMDLRDRVAGGELSELKPGGAINLIVDASDRYNLNETGHVTRSEVYRLQIVAPEELLALLERRELALRARLEQTIDETRSLRDSLDLLQRQAFDAGAAEADADPTRQRQVRLLRVQQSGLQARKTSEELSGIAFALDDILQEMVNNRVDSVDRRERIGVGVRDPLRQIVQEPLQRLQDQIDAVEKSVDELETARTKSAEAVQTAEEVLLQLTAVLDKMLDLESYNEILDMVRDLIGDQTELLDDTKTERKKRVLELFE